MARRKLAAFRAVFLASHWLRRRLSPAGLMLAALTGAAAAFGLDTQANLAHGLFTLGACLLGVDALFAALLRRRAPPLGVRRRLPEFLSAGQPASYVIAVRNDGGQPLAPARLVEQPAQPWPAPLALQPDRAAGNRFDRWVGYPAFVDLLRRLRVVDVEPVALPALLPGQQVELELAVLPLARGQAVFERLLLAQRGPLGLVELSRPLGIARAGLPVLPRRLAVDLPPASNLRQLQPGGISLAQHVGDAEEFRSLRDYRPGDPLRAIHWRSFARTGKPVVREFQEEFFSRHALVLDTAAPPDDAAGLAFETAVSLAAWLVARPRDADSLLDLFFVGDRVHRLSAGRGLGGADGMLQLLATVSPTPADSVVPLLASVERNAPQLASVVLIFLCWDDLRQQAVRRLLAHGLTPTILLVDGDAAADAGGEVNERTEVTERTGRGESTADAESAERAERGESITGFGRTELPEFAGLLRRIAPVPAVPAIPPLTAGRRAP